ncbi:MAG: hypothetical protein IJ703_08800 [Eubacterium sp.]|nr:hypothetical protein [Eubacterium sp.]
MKAKYFLRGIGLGLLVGVLLMFAAIKLLGYEKVDDKKDNTVTEATTEKKTTESTTETTTEATTETTTEATTEKTTETTTEATTEATTEVTTEDTTETTEATTEATTEKTTESPDGKVTITVVGGMYSTEVAEMLQEKGIIDDYLDFDRWLDSTGYSTLIRVGDFTFEKGMSYEEIATILTSGH